MKGRVLIIVPLLINQYDGAMNRVSSAIEMYKRNGYEVYILDIFPAYYLFKIFKHKKNLNLNAHWLFLPSFSLMRSPFLQCFSVFIAQIWIYFLTRLISFRIVQFDMYYGGRVCKYRKKDSKLIMNYRGDSIDEFLYANPSENMLGWKVKSIEKDVAFSIRQADILLTVSENLKKSVEKYTDSCIQHFFIMPCCADIERFKIDLSLLDELKIKYEDKLVIGYCGGMAKWQNVDVILDLVIALKKKNPQIYFLLLTSESLESVQSKLNELGDNNYEYHSLSRDKVPFFLSCMNASFLIRENRPLNIVASPTKISESLAAGVPVIATRFAGDIEDVVIDGKNGIILSDMNYTEEDIDRILSYLLKVKSQRGYFRSLCQKSIEERTWNNYSDNYIRYIESLL